LDRSSSSLDDRNADSGDQIGNVEPGDSDALEDDLEDDELLDDPYESMLFTIQSSM